MNELVKSAVKFKVLWSAYIKKHKIKSLLIFLLIFILSSDDKEKVYLSK